MNDFKIYKNNHVEEIYFNILFGILVGQLLTKYKKDISTSSYGPTREWGYLENSLIPYQWKYFSFIDNQPMTKRQNTWR